MAEKEQRQSLHSLHEQQHLPFHCQNDHDEEPIFDDFIHEHPLALMHKRDDAADCGVREPEFCCIVCCKSCPFPAYSCRTCDIYLHESCATNFIPDWVNHPIFQGHSLQMSTGSFICRICLKFRSGIHYRCSDAGCNFELDVGCASKVDHPFIMFDGHPHPLIFLENHTHRLTVECDACDKPCEPHRSSFNCVTCDFDLHLLCGPLPCSLEQQGHSDTLILKDSHIHDDRMMDDEFYCDYCTETRDPRECVYYCGRCDYYAEIKCIMPELLSALMGKCGDVALRTLGRWNHSGKVASRGLSAQEIQEHRVRVEGLEKPAGISLKDIEQSLTENEKRKLTDILDNKENLLEELRCETHHGYFIELVAEFESLEISSTLRGNWHNNNILFVQVGDYLVPHELIDVYNDLHHKYGDVSVESNLSCGLKAFFFLYLCRTLERMWAVRVLDATKDEISNWWISLKVVRIAGFKIQFAIDGLMRATCGWFELQRIEQVNELESNIAFGENDIQNMKAEWRETDEKLKQYKEDLKSRGCRVAQECLQEAGAVLYKTAYEVIG